MSSDRSFFVVDVVTLSSDRRSLMGVAEASPIEPPGVENRLRGPAGDVGGDCSALGHFAVMPGKA